MCMLFRERAKWVVMIHRWKTTGKVTIRIIIDNLNTTNQIVSWVYMREVSQSLYSSRLSRRFHRDVSASYCLNHSP